MGVIDWNSTTTSFEDESLKVWMTKEFWDFILTLTTSWSWMTKFILLGVMSNNCDAMGTLLPHTLYMPTSTLHSRPIHVWCGFEKWAKLLSTSFMTMTLEGMKLPNMQRWYSRTTTIPLLSMSRKKCKWLPCILNVAMKCKYYYHLAKW